MKPDIGQVVLYSLTEEQAEQISRRRQEAGANLSGLSVGVVPGDTVPMLVAAIASGYGDGLCAVAGRLLIDDEDENWWVTSVTEGVEPGAWRPL
jgi:hypothetical protein